MSDRDDGHYWVRCAWARRGSSCWTVAEWVEGLDGIILYPGYWRLPGSEARHSDSDMEEIDERRLDVRDARS